MKRKESEEEDVCVAKGQNIGWERGSEGGLVWERVHTVMSKESRYKKENDLEWNCHLYKKKKRREHRWNVFCDPKLKKNFHEL